jgi:tryptophan 2,3-dioxygenase
MSKPLSYGDYLRLDELLGCQRPESVRQGRAAHDEMLFIVVHQAYELWFKQILVELDEIQRIFAREHVEERDIGRIVHALTRVWEIWKLLIRQLDVLETMTPLDFLEFRDLLVPASGFQSLQFRLIEVRLGLSRERRASQYAHTFDRQLGAADGSACAAPKRSRRCCRGSRRGWSACRFSTSAATASTRSTANPCSTC